MKLPQISNKVIRNVPKPLPSLSFLGMGKHPREDIIHYNIEVISAVLESGEVVFNRKAIHQHRKRHPSTGHQSL
jgi:hypothetical protein